MPDTYYVIKKVLESCDYKIVCYDCQMYSYAYNHTCLNATLHVTICKHIHLLHMEISDNIV